MSYAEPMKFHIGQRIRLVRPYYFCYYLRKEGMEGTVVGHRSHGTRGKYMTHYVIQWDCYMYIHTYMRCDIEMFCDIIK